MNSLRDVINNQRGLCVKMAATGCVEDKRNSTESDKFVVSTGFEVLSIKTGMGKRKNSTNYDFHDKTALCMRVEIEKLANCLNGFKSPRDNQVDLMQADLMEADLVQNGRKRRRALRFDSSESSDSGVAALSSTDSSQSSATSDFTEPCSPPSPDTPRSCTPLQPGPCFPCAHGFSHLSTSTTNGQEECPGLQCCDQGSACLTTSTAAKRNLTQDVFGNDTRLVVSSSTDDIGQESPVRRCRTQEPVVSSSSQLDDVKEFLSFNDDTLSLTEFQAPDKKKKKKNEIDAFKIGGSKDTAKATNADSSCGKKKQQQQKVSPGAPSSNAASSGEIVCQWDKCAARLKNGAEVVEHLQSVHVASQVESESFVCLWSSCKVYKKSSCSFSWLERHVVSHAGNKPFQCIVDGCGHRFTTQGGLERHVNGHFSQPTSNGNGSNGGSSNGMAVASGSAANSTTSTTRRKDDTPTKVLKKKKMMRYWRRACAVKTEDFFDSGIMESVQQHLVALNKSTQMDVAGDGSTITFHSSIRARRIEGTGKVRVLLHWYPENMIPDKWVLESQVQEQAKRTVPIWSLPSNGWLNVNGYRTEQRRVRKNCRK